MFAIQYHCRVCRSSHRSRCMKKPDANDLTNFAEAEKKLERLTPNFIPNDLIPAGDETDRLHRWGYSRYRELFNERQLLGLELICREISKEENPKIQRALATNLSDLL